MEATTLTRSQLIKIKRQQELRRHIIIGILAGFIFIMATTLFFGIKGIASDGSDVEYYKYFKTVMMTEDDSIEGLAEIYANPEMTTVQTYIQEVMFINSIDSLESPISGKYIIIPYYDTLHS